MSPQELLLKYRERYPDDPDEIRAEREKKLKEENEFRQLLMSRHRYIKMTDAKLKKAREVRNYKPKTSGEAENGQ